MRSGVTVLKTPSMEVAVYRLHNFSISFFSSLLEEDVVSVKLDNSASGASVVAVDNKIDQALDLVQQHVMFAVHEEVEVLKRQVRELAERNLRLEQENRLLRTLASPRDAQALPSLSPSQEASSLARGPPRAPCVPSIPLTN